MLQSLPLDYQEYNVSVGNANFCFISNANSNSDIQTNGITMHSHKFYEMFYVLSGSVIVHTEYGNLYLSEGDFASVAPGVSHTTMIQPNSRRLAMFFCLEQGQTKTGNYYQIFQDVLQEKTLLLPSFSGANAFKRFTKYLNSDHPDKTELLNSCLHEIMVLVKASKTEAPPSQDTPKSTDSNNYRDYFIDDYFVNQFQYGSLVNLSELLHLSPQQTQRIIKSLYNQTFTERITIMKMEYAKKLLSTTDMSVTQIAAECGYTGTNGFFVAFKKYFGTTPKELRKEIEQTRGED